jgi:hypothetical protein
MPSRGNPNVPNKQRRVANRKKVQKRSAAGKVTKNPRGTARSNVLHPTSGPLAPVSGKKARKLEKAKNHARQRAIEKAMEQEGEVQMTGISVIHNGERILIVCRRAKGYESEDYKG